MKTLIVYGSRKGCTERCALKLRDEIIRAGGGRCDVINASKANRSTTSEFDGVIVGSSIWAGKTHRAVKKYMEAFNATLPPRRLGLFLCSGENDRDYFTRNFSDEAITQAVELRFFGGDLQIEDFGPFMRFILRKKAGVTESYRRVDDREIRSFAQAWVTGGEQ